ncbi:hypothetical protein F2Q70_00029025 [Brassica cretica]|uniref:Uncharacterized protein n=1 Tax=Brassica cretica TaxID=69181 RepID=A0A8S9FL97_BRACR|nr:hypothetical protein F2Q70_00029025 [Brassica cretica]
MQGFQTRSVTKIGQASTNQNLMVVATKFCSLLLTYIQEFFAKASLEDCCLQVPFRTLLLESFMNQALMVLPPSPVQTRPS